MENGKKEEYSGLHMQMNNLILSLIVLSFVLLHQSNLVNPVKMLKTFHRFTHTTRFLRQHIQHLHTSFKLFSKTQEEDDDIVLDDPLDMELEDPTKPEKTTFWDTLWGSRTKDAGLLKYRYTHFYNNKPIPGPADDVQIPDTQNIRDGKRLFSMKCELITSAGKEHEFPKPGPPEIAFAGRLANFDKVLSKILGQMLGNRV